MKTKEILDKYTRLISGLIKCEPKDIKFFTVESTIYGMTDRAMEVMLKSAREINEVIYMEPEKDDKGNETGKKIEVRYDWCEGKYIVVLQEKVLLASFELYKLPHCCAILVSCKAFVNPLWRGRRVGTILNTLRQDLGRLLGYSTLMCTDINQNTHQRKLLATNGWKDIYEVKNKRTGNLVHVSVINL